MNQFKIGDRVRAVKKSKHFAPFEKGWEGVIEDITDKYPNFFVLFENDDDSWWLEADEIELIEAEPNQSVPKSFPTFEEFHEWYRTEQGNMQGVYHYFAQFGKQPSQPNSKPFPTFEEFDAWYSETEPVKSNGECKWTQQVYDYLVQFGVREVFPEVGKEYEFSYDGMNWEKVELGGFKEAGANWTFKYIRPIQPSRLEQLMEKHPNLTDTEQTELLDLLLTQNKQNK